MTSHNNNPTTQNVRTPDPHHSPQTNPINSPAIGTPAFYKPDGTPSSNQPNPLGHTSAAGINQEMDQMNLVDQTVQLDNLKCFVKARFWCNKEELYALEADKQLRGYNGQCPKCDKNHISFNNPNRGFYASVKNIHEKVYKDKLVDDRIKRRNETDDLLSIEENLPPLNRPNHGDDKGIEGDSNSCYMDATLFCMFAYSNVFDSLLHVNVEGKPLQKLQTLLRKNIVNVLRSENGLVSRDAMFHLRTQLSEAKNDPSFQEMEKDPSEFLRALEDLFHYAPLQTIPPDQPRNETSSNITTNIMWEMFDANPHRLLFTTIASIFRNSLVEIPAKLATIPPFLILVAPRIGRSQRSYRYIIPDRQITLDNNILQLVCLKCKKTNHGSDKQHDFYACNECYLQESSLFTSPSSTDAIIKCYCSGCLKDSHSPSKLTEKERLEHVPKPIKTDKHKLNLFAVLCIETSHYVAFVKCKTQDQQHEWLFFDSMKDRVCNEKNIPCVSRVLDFDLWIDEAEKGQDQFFKNLDELRRQARPTSQTFSESGMRQLRLFRDDTFFFYENSSVNYH